MTNKESFKTPKWSFMKYCPKCDKETIDTHNIRTNKVYCAICKSVKGEDNSFFGGAKV